MNLKKGSLVKLLDGYGNTVVEQVTVARCGIGGIVFVHDMVNGEELTYGVPEGSVKPVEIEVKKEGTK